MRWNEIITHDLQQLTELLFSYKNALRFIGLFFVITLAYFVLMGILLLNPIDINPSLSVLNVGLTVVISGITALIFVITWTRAEQKSVLSVKKTSFLGSTIGLFATSCTVCQPIWLLWLGLGSASAFLIEWGLPVLLISISFLLVGLHQSLKLDNASCDIPSKELVP